MIQRKIRRPDFSVMLMYDSLLSDPVVIRIVCLSTNYTNSHELRSEWQRILAYQFGSFQLEATSCCTIFANL